MWGPRVLFQGSSYAYARANRAEVIGGSGKQPILHATDAVLISSFHVVGFPHLEAEQPSWKLSIVLLVPLIPFSSNSEVLICRDW